MNQSGLFAAKPFRVLVTAIIGVCGVLSHQSACAAETAAVEKNEELTFEHDILPIFRTRCFRCHAGVEPKGGLNLSRPSALLVGGDSGAAIRIAAAESSLLYEKISSNEMPLAGQKLSASEKGMIRKWINDGAEGIVHATNLDRSEDISDVELWSFVPPVRPPVPAVAAKPQVRNPIDAFILRSLEDRKLSFAPEASHSTLLRRASFDLTGLPPSPEEVEQIRHDGGPDVYAQMIDRLLASPRYGEHWGRHWLDVAGYTDSAGVLSSDVPLPLAYRYRDYVLRAFNDDKPYDRFLQEQIAGDELTGYWTAFETMDRLPDDVVEGITATGFLRTAADASRPDFSGIKNAAGKYFYPTMFDTLQIVCSSTMGLTVQCARCHSHKFDPIPQADYYRLQAIFMGGFRPTEWIPQTKRRLKIASKKQIETAETINAAVDADVQPLKAEFDEYKQDLANRVFAKRLAELPAHVREEVKSA
ncbi:MAG: DUF1549 domain-containing protein, partial [Planctomycetaceae bacterium]